MIHKKGQGAMEYLMTYGWAILVVVIVGIVLVNMGVLDLGGQTVNTQEGFSQVKPLEWSCDAATGNVQIVATNGAGGRITNADISVEGTDGACDPTNPDAGDTSICSVDAVTECSAVESGSQYELAVDLSYTSPQNLTRTSSGTVKGAAD